MEIYFETDKTYTSVSELLDDGFTGEDGKFVRTYYDKEYKLKQCHEARRSFKDLLNICKTYIPNATEKELATYLLKTRCIYCPDIKRWVFRYTRISSHDVWDIKPYLSSDIDVDGYSADSIKAFAGQ